MSERFVKVCSRCGSRDFYVVGRNVANLACKGCGYRGTFIEVSESEAKKIKGKPSKYFSPFPMNPRLVKGHNIFVKLLILLAGLLILYILISMVGGFYAV